MTQAKACGYLLKERAKGIEPSTSTLGRLHSTAELRPRNLLLLCNYEQIWGITQGDVKDKMVGQAHYQWFVYAHHDGSASLTIYQAAGWMASVRLLFTGQRYSSLVLT